MPANATTSRTTRAAFFVAGLSGALAVAIAAWLAHAGGGFDAVAQDRMETAVRYQIWHSLLLAVVAIALSRAPTVALRLSAGACIAGLVLFSGSLHLLALTDIPALAWLTPFGGLAFILAWLALAWHGLMAHQRRDMAP